MKEKLYFITAAYFQFWAKIIMKKWQPFIIGVVGSAGKSSTLSLIDYVFSSKDLKISYKTNAVTAIPLDILGLTQEKFNIGEWIKLFFLAPVRAFGKAPVEKIYVCEMDSDRIGEMKSHTRLIKPNITCWTSCYPAHTQGFPGKNEAEIERSMAFDIGWAVEENKGIVLVNGESELLKSQLKRSNNPIGFISLENKNEATITLSEYKISLTGTRVSFRINMVEFKKLFAKLYPNKEIGRIPLIVSLNFPYAVVSKVGMYGVAMSILIGLLMGKEENKIVENLKNWRLPSGRMNLFAGIKATTVIDSSYNASSEATIDAIKTLKILGGEKTMAVIGDMRELGELSQREHEKVAKEIVENKIRRIVLVGPNTHKYIYPYLVENGYLENRTVFKAENPKWAADLLASEDFLRTGEIILVKGSQNTLFLEGVIERILASKKDKQFLCRREERWQKERNKIYN